MSSETKGLTIKAEPFLQKNTIETTGAGDTFTGCMLNTVLDKGLDNLTGEAVSYTHLDVYKRQILQSALMILGWVLRRSRMIF